MRFVKVVSTLGALALLLSACGSSGNQVATTTSLVSKDLVVVATTPQIADFVSIIGGSHVTVNSLLKNGVEPHNYKMTAADINAIGSADLTIQNGLGLEPWFDNAIGTIEHKGPIVNASDSVTTRSSNDPASHGVDPHIWLSLVNARQMVANIREALAAADPADATEFEATERAYLSQIDALSNRATQALGSLTNKTIVTDHDSLQYFCDEFHLDCLASLIPTSNPPTPPTTAQITAVAVSLTGTNTRVVFAQASESPEPARELAKDLGVKVVEGNDALYADTLGAPGSDADTYLKMQSHNLSMIVNNLR